MSFREVPYLLIVELSVLASVVSIHLDFRASYRDQVRIVLSTSSLGSSHLSHCLMSLERNRDQFTVLLLQVGMVLNLLPI